jgi:hypothetical protein
MIKAEFRVINRITRRVNVVIGIFESGFCDTQRRVNLISIIHDFNAEQDGKVDGGKGDVPMEKAD